MYTASHQHWSVVAIQFLVQSLELGFGQNCAQILPQSWGMLYPPPPARSLGHPPTKERRSCTTPTHQSPQYLKVCPMVAHSCGHMIDSFFFFFFFWNWSCVTDVSTETIRPGAPRNSGSHVFTSNIKFIVKRV